LAAVPTDILGGSPPTRRSRSGVDLRPQRACTMFVVMPLPSRLFPRVVSRRVHETSAITCFLIFRLSASLLRRDAATRIPCRAGPLTRVSSLSGSTPPGWRNGEDEAARRPAPRISTGGMNHLGGRGRLSPPPTATFQARALSPWRGGWTVSRVEGRRRVRVGVPGGGAIDTPAPKRPERVGFVSVLLRARPDARCDSARWQLRSAAPGPGGGSAWNLAEVLFTSAPARSGLKSAHPLPARVDLGA